MKTVLYILFTALLVGVSVAQQSGGDPGKVVIASLEGTLIHGTNAEGKVVTVKPVLRNMALAQKGTSFSHYYKIGQDRSSVYKAYQGWLKPIKGSEDIMMSYEPKSIKEDGIELCVDFWQQGRKVFTTTADLQYAKPLLITGPSWRKGKILIALDLQR